MSVWLNPDGGKLFPRGNEVSSELYTLYCTPDRLLCWVAPYCRGFSFPNSMGSWTLPNLGSSSETVPSRKLFLGGCNRKSEITVRG